MHQMCNEYDGKISVACQQSSRSTAHMHASKSHTRVLQNFVMTGITHT